MSEERKNTEVEDQTKDVQEDNITRDITPQKSPIHTVEENNDTNDEQKKKALVEQQDVVTEVDANPESTLPRIEEENPQDDSAAQEGDTKEIADNNAKPIQDAGVKEPVSEEQANVKEATAEESLVNTEESPVDLDNGHDKPAPLVYEGEQTTSSVIKEDEVEVGQAIEPDQKMAEELTSPLGEKSLPQTPEKSSYDHLKRDVSELPQSPSPQKSSVKKSPT